MPITGAAGTINGLPVKASETSKVQVYRRYSDLLTDVRNFPSWPDSLKNGKSVTFKTNYQRFDISLNDNNVQIVVKPVPYVGFLEFLKHAIFRITHSSRFGLCLGHTSLQSREDEVKQHIAEILSTEKKASESTAFPASQNRGQETVHSSSEASEQKPYLSQQQRSRLFGQRNLSAEEKTIRQQICRHFRVPYSEWPRQYPPLSSKDTKEDRQVGAESIQVFKAYMDKYHMEERRAKEAAGIRPDNTTKGILQWILGIIAPEWENLSTDGAHGYGHSYADDAILRVVGAARDDRVEEIDLNGLPAWRINGNIVILQPATRGCTAAVAAMLIADQGGEVNVHALRNTNLGDDSTITALIREAGFQPVISPLSGPNKEKMMKALKDAINKNGPAIVTVDSGIGGHVVVVDAISDTSVTVRDPAHGWMVAISRADFMRSLSNYNILQIQQQSGRRPVQPQNQKRHEQPSVSGNGTQPQPFNELSVMIKNRLKQDAAKDKATEDKWQRNAQQKTGWAARTVSTRNEEGVELFGPGGITAWRMGGKTVVSQQSILEKGMLQLKELTSGKHFLSGVASIIMLLADQNRHSYLKGDLTGCIDGSKGDCLALYFNLTVQKKLPAAMQKKPPRATYSAFSAANAQENMKQLKQALNTHGSVISVVKNRTEKSSFFVVVDAVHDGLVTVRDPTRDAIVQIAEDEFIKYIQWYSGMVRIL